MNEWWLVGFLIAMTLGAIIIISYPLRRNKIVCVLMTPIIVAMVSIGYYFWGGFAQWQEFLQQNNSQALAENMLKSVKSPDELIVKLRAKLDDSSKSAKGWYLLGRLYTSQNKIQEASKSFAKAYQLKPDEEQFAVHYAHSLWILNKEQFNDEIVTLFKALIKKNPNQPDALAMLAMNAFLSHAYEDAIDYWQQLLKLAPEQSEESMALRKAIAKAQEKINIRSKNND